MFLKKLIVKNYKIFENIQIELNNGLNIFIGENDSGKSTILEVLSILTTGKLNGFAFERLLNANMFNNKVRKEYIKSISDNKPKAPPQIILEAFFDGDPQCKGINNTLYEDDCGINVTVKIADDNSEVYQKLLSEGKLKDIPIELYEIKRKYFSGETVNYRYGPFKGTFIDTTKKDYFGVIDHYITDSIENNFTDDQKRDLSIAFNESKRTFRGSNIVRELNKAVNDIIQDKNVSLGIKENEVDAWRKHISLVIDDIPFESIGFGSQNAIKIELALKNIENQANILLMEEPENNLSFSNITKLVDHVSSSKGKQVFISTHSSYIANKLDLKNVLLLHKGSIQPYSNLEEESRKFFLKQPEYNTLRFILASKIILVEGPTDDLIIQRAYKDKYNRLPSADGIDIFVVGSLSFKHYCNIAILMNKSIAVVTDNDGNKKKNIIDRYEKYSNNNITFYYEENNSLNTIEPSVLSSNSTDNIPNESFVNIIYKSKNKYDKNTILNFMLNHKVEWALRVFEDKNNIAYPQYIKNVIAHYENHEKSC